MANKLLIFDIDGVLVDVSQSYRVAIKKTAEFFLGVILDDSVIDEFKRMPGMNNDYDCTEAILKSKNILIRKEIIIKKFQEYYVGREFSGLILNEEWLIKNNILDKLSKKYKLAVFTGRPREEAEFVIKRNKADKYFKTMVCMEDVKNQKPSPEGILKILNQTNIKSAVYIGDSIDDLNSAKAANIEFIGIIPSYANKVLLKNKFSNENVENILEDVNDLIKIL